MPTRFIHTITFDLDDTLWDASTVLSNAEQQVFNWLKQYAPRVTDQFTLENLRQLRIQMYQNTPQLTHQITKLRIHTMQKIMEHVGYEPQHSAEMAEQSFAVFIEARNQVTLFDEVIPMLETLKKNYTLGTLTNGNADVSKLPIANWLDFSYSAEQLNASKPSPELFVAAQQATGCEAGEMIHVGDHIEHDILGAHQAGCHSLWYNPSTSTHPYQHLATIQVQSLADIPQAISDFENSLIEASSED